MSNDSRVEVPLLEPRSWGLQQTDERVPGKASQTTASGKVLYLRGTHFEVREGGDPGQNWDKFGKESDTVRRVCAADDSKTTNG